MFDVGSRQKMTDMDSKRATSKCIATALVCQPYWVSCFSEARKPALVGVGCSVIGRVSFLRLLVRSSVRSFVTFDVIFRKVKVRLS